MDVKILKKKIYLKKKKFFFYKIQTNFKIWFVVFFFFKIINYNFNNFLFLHKKKINFIFLFKSNFKKKIIKLKKKHFYFLDNSAIFNVKKIFFILKSNHFLKKKINKKINFKLTFYKKRMAKKNLIFKNKIFNCTKMFKLNKKKNLFFFKFLLFDKKLNSFEIKSFFKNLIKNTFFENNQYFLNNFNTILSDFFFFLNKTTISYFLKKK